MPRSVKLIGLDFGTTTSSAVVATAQLTRNIVTGRSELAQLDETYRSEMIFTPVRDDRLDIERLTQCLDNWLAAAGVVRDDIFGGGAILTGLTAQKTNADALIQLINQRLGEALIAVAEDPCYESWLAFMGSCAGLSRENPDRPVINLDIGGGTTNVALGKNGDVLRTGCLFAGARHIQVDPGTYRMSWISSYAARLLDYLHIRKVPGDCLHPAEVDQIVEFYVMLMRATLTGESDVFRNPMAQLHQQTPFVVPTDCMSPIITVSGGVAELVYSHLQGKPWPPTTCYGDLGVDLARRLVEIPELLEQVRSFVPSGGGRATVYGLLRHSTQVSGNTLFLPDPNVLPLRNVPIVGSISLSSADTEIDGRLSLAARNTAGGALLLKLGADHQSHVQRFGKRLGEALTRSGFPATRPLVIMVDQNAGKVLGNSVTNWGSLPFNLIVVDQVDVREAQFVQLGKLQNQVVAVSFFGVQS